MSEVVGPDFRDGSGRDHYSYVTRSLLSLFEAGELPNVKAVVVEPEYGYTAQIVYTDGSTRMTWGNDIGLNSGAAADAVTDKGHTKFFLRQWGINCPDGKEFLLPWWADAIGRGRPMQANAPMTTTDSAPAYVDQAFGYPVYVKPVDGSKGGGVHKVYDSEQLETVLAAYEERRVKVAMVEKPVDMPDYRIVTLDGQLISAYRRNPLAVVGNGHDTIGNLLNALQRQYYGEGRDTRIEVDDPRIIDFLRRQDLAMGTVPPDGMKVSLAAISNLSAGGTSEDVTKEIHERWVQLAALVAGKFSLRLSGLDLACADITDRESDYSVLEVNAAPGLDHYASTGEPQARVVRGLYAKVFNALPAAVRLT